MNLKRAGKKGQLLKRGDGPVNYSWGPRYVILEGQTLYYYSNQQDS